MELRLNRPAVAGRILELFPYDMGEGVPVEIDKDTFIEDLLFELDSGEKLLVFVPNVLVDPSLVGQRVLVELDAFLGDRLLLPSEISHQAGWKGDLRRDSRSLMGKVETYYRDGVIVEVGQGTVGVSELQDDRFEPGRYLMVSNFRLDLRQVLAYASYAGQWVSLIQDPFEDLAKGLSTIRSGGIRRMVMPRLELDRKFRPRKDLESVLKYLGDELLANLVYRFGEARFMEAEPELTTFLTDEDFTLRKAAAWVLARYWGLRKYRDRLLELASGKTEGGSRVTATIGVGILSRGSHDPFTTQRLISLLRHRQEHWYVKEAAYLALLGVWLPETSAQRDSFRAWSPWYRKDDNRFKTWEKWAQTHIDWDLVTRLHRESRTSIGR